MLCFASASIDSILLNSFFSSQRTFFLCMFLFNHFPMTHPDPPKRTTATVITTTDNPGLYLSMCSACLPMHSTTPLDLRSFQHAKVRAIQKATHGGRGALGWCVTAVPNALVSVQLCLKPRHAKHQQWHERFQTNNQHVYVSSTIAWWPPPTCMLHV